MKKTESFIAYGHRLIKSTHKTTFEITKDDYLTEKGDCIIAVKSQKACADLSSAFKEIARKPDAKIVIRLNIGKYAETVIAKGDPRLTLTHPREMVIRKSSHICDRTLAISADKAALDLSRSFVKKLQSPECVVKITITATAPEELERIKER